MTIKKDLLNFLEANYKGPLFSFIVLYAIMFFLERNAIFEKYYILNLGLVIIIFVLIFKLPYYFIDRLYPETVKVFKHKVILLTNKTHKNITIILIVGFVVFVAWFASNFFSAEANVTLKGLFVILVFVFIFIIYPFVFLSKPRTVPPNYFDRIILTKTQLIVYYFRGKIMKFKLDKLEFERQTDDDILLKDTGSVDSLLLNIEQMMPKEKEELSYYLKAIE